MGRWKKDLSIVVGVFIVLVLGGARWYLSMAVFIETGYASRYICSVNSKN
jgi:uncharacterized membrane protein YphA (DoxX/SURF4 family)